MWREIAGLNAKIKRNPDYYRWINKYEEIGVHDFRSIIVMDVKRTLDNNVHEQLSKSLIAVLVNYSKYYRIK